MINLMELTPVKTYVSKENVIKAVKKTFPNIENTNMRFFIHKDESGRYFPVFVGERSAQHGSHFHFVTIA